jgi:hypothetical protein
MKHRFFEPATIGWSLDPQNYVFYQSNKHTGFAKLRPDQPTPPCYRLAKVWSTFGWNAFSRTGPLT